MYRHPVIMFGQASSGFSAEYQAVLDYADTQGFTKPSEAENIINNAIIENLKTESVWSEFAHFFKFKYNDTNLDDFSRIDWVNLFDLSVVGTPIYSNDGWKAGTGGTSDRLRILSADLRIDEFCTQGDTTVIYQRADATESGGYGHDNYFGTNRQLKYQNSGRMYINTGSLGQAFNSNSGANTLKIFTSHNGTSGAKYYYMDGVLRQTRTYTEQTADLRDMNFPITCVLGSSLSAPITSPIGILAMGSGAIGQKYSEVTDILKGTY